MTKRRCLLSVHAHPDDEASKGAGTIARYHSEGVHTVLVTCTGGEEGEILNPNFQWLDSEGEIAKQRLTELERSAAIIGYDELVLLGYRDSGMEGAPSNEDPRSFHQAPLEEAVGRLVAVIRRTKPQVVITYPDEQSGYRHPDHLRVHEISVQAFHAAADPERYQELGAPFAPSKLYYSVWSKQQFIQRHAKFQELGLPSPYEEGHLSSWFERDDQPATTRIDLGPFANIRHSALLAHETQIDPSSHFWFGLPEDVERSIFSYEMFMLAESRVGQISEGEGDLFSGVH